MTNIFQRAATNIIDNLKRPQKYRAIRSYARRVGRLLQATYGKQITYTSLQIKKILKEWGYSTKYDCYALAMYCSDVDFIEYHNSIGESCNYEAMRREIGYCLSGSNADFSTASLIDGSFQFDAPGHADRIEQHHHYDGSADAGYHSHHDYGGDSCGSDFGGGFD
ncbi:DUF6559 family protein [Chamaesiphon sp. VAR_48_metabat_403]|uniref:DUF6559 family protein n=1 Tax=Chamaesiphon sp. VAR_48_metabat_403 TaxID=2964700 RepID=UPI00286DE2C8|nr:DUF6559 family protein [Chamaesiphon sp. VAR_48_metabat_403]